MKGSSYILLKGVIEWNFVLWMTTTRFGGIVESLDFAGMKSFSGLGTESYRSKTV
ncbi:diacetyl reductase ((R)-acetoin forming) domain protein [Ligilactobacillus ruminis]|nr:diacetyl reductase ((R)-acetoin forming) domain protein [Ligilactobacillus ruminis]